MLRTDNFELKQPTNICKNYLHPGFCMTLLVCTTQELSTSKILYDITRVYYTRTIYIQDSAWHYSCIRDNQSHDLFDGSLLSNFIYRYLYLNTYLFTCIVNLIIFLWSSWVVLSCSRNWLCYWKLVVSETVHTPQ